MKFNRTLWFFLFCQIFVVLVNCDSLTVNTKSGFVKGIKQRTHFLNKPYLSFRGIPYAEKPLGHFRYKVPVPVKPWSETLIANKYKDACFALAQFKAPPSNATQSEDCLYLNVFTPVLRRCKEKCSLPVMFFIYGGLFVSGDSEDAYFGPDQIIENDVILVTVGYRLGPFGFMNFELPGYTGNMGLKDQQLALKWTKKNIKYFGGDPNAITVVGHSVGGVSVQLHALNEQSRKYFARAVAMSGTTSVPFAHYEKNNQLDLMYDTFREELDHARDPVTLLQFMKTAPADLLVQKTPAVDTSYLLARPYWSTVIEDERKASRPFLTETPRQIYQTKKIRTDMIFGISTAESIIDLDVKNTVVNRTQIGLPFHGLSLSPESDLYKELSGKIYDYYIGNDTIQNTTDYQNKLIQMASAMNYYYGFYDALNLHKNHAKTFCYQFDVNLNLNVIKIMENLRELRGASHFDEMPYIFYSHEIENLYAQVVQNLDDPENQKTLNAIRFVSKFFTDIVKNGRPNHAKQIKGDRYACADITNDGVKSIFAPKLDVFKFFQWIHNRVKPYIFNEF